MDHVIVAVLTDGSTVSEPRKPPPPVMPAPPRYSRVLRVNGAAKVSWSCEPRPVVVTVEAQS